MFGILVLWILTLRISVKVSLIIRELKKIISFLHAKYIKKENRDFAIT